MRSLRPIPLAAALLIAPAAQAGELLDIFARAQQQDTTLQAARHGRDAEREARPQALAALLPQLSASAAQNWQRTRADSVELIDPSQPDLGTQEITSRSSTQTHSFAISATQPLFDYAALRRYAQAGDRVALAETRYQAAEQDLVLRVAEAYFAVLSADDAQRSFDAQRRAFERALEEAQRRFEVGVAPITDVQEAQASRDLAAAQQLEAAQALDAARQALAEITGAPVGGWARLREDITLPEAGRSLDAWIADALTQNFELIAAEAEAGIAADSVSIARAGHLPTLGLSAARSLRDDDDSAGRSDSGSVALQLSMPLFAGGGIASQVREARAVQKQSEALALGQRRFVERSTRDAWQGVTTGHARVLAYRQAVQSSRTALEASESGLRVGTRRLLDVLNAQQQLSAAERDYEQSRYDYLLAVLRLQAAAGQLDVNGLAMVDALLADASR